MLPSYVPVRLAPRRAGNGGTGPTGPSGPSGSTGPTGPSGPAIDKFAPDAIVDPVAGQGTHTTIQAAVNALQAANGGWVHVRRGTYNENVVVGGTAIRITGAGAGANN